MSPARRDRCALPFGSAVTARRGAAIALAASAALLVTGCGQPLLGGGQGALTIASLREGGTLAPAARTAIYRSADKNTADLIISDLPLESLASLGVADTQPVGVVVHVHMFLLPKAGRTPIDPTASNATTTVYVFAGDAAGVYRGGGFFLPSDEPGGRNFHGRLADADLRLFRASDYFNDRLGPSTMSGRLSVRRDGPATASILDRLAVIGAQIPATAGEHDPLSDR
jgi:hypothetical protein